MFLLSGRLNVLFLLLSTFCFFFSFFNFYQGDLLVTSPLLHLWRAAHEDCASKCLMNKACVMERQTLCVLELLCLLSFRGLSISRHRRTPGLLKNDHIQEGSDSHARYR